MGESVLYVMAEDKSQPDDSALAKAQAYAISQKLPLAVLLCINPDINKYSREYYEALLSDLEELEKTLGRLKIPFMLLIGDPKERLAGAFYHLRLDTVYFDAFSNLEQKDLWKSLAKAADIPFYEVKKPATAPRKLIKHPFPWTGPIIPIKKLRSRIAEALSATGDGKC